jgi:hypothetical protein
MVEPSRVDATAAEEFGHVVHLFGRSDRRPSVLNLAEYSVAILHALEEVRFDPKSDVFALTGSVLSLVTAFHVLATRYGDFTVLAYSASECKYVKKPFDREWVDRAIAAA